MLACYTKIFVFVWEVPEQYQCDAAACQATKFNHSTTCYIDRPRQKTFVNGIMITSSMIINAINIIELLQISTNSLSEKVKNK